MIKRIYIFSLMLFLVSMQTFAQVRFGIKAGFNLANMTDKDRNGTYSNDYKMKEGFHLGVTAEYSISNNFSLEPGLLYSSKGFTKPEYKAGIDGHTVDEPEIKITSNYLEVPINAIYKINLGSVKILLNAGPYLAYALSGKLKANKIWFGINEDQTERKLKIGNQATDDFKALDYGLNAGAGIEFKKISLGLQYGLGLANIAPSSDIGYTLNNKVISLSLSYKFGHKSDRKFRHK